MEGTKEIDELMCPVKTAIERHVKDRTAFTDIYNRAYEALMISMDVKDALRAENERLREALETVRAVARNKANPQADKACIIGLVDDALRGGDA